MKFKEEVCKAAPTECQHLNVLLECCFSLSELQHFFHQQLFLNIEEVGTKTLDKTETFYDDMVEVSMKWLKSI